jgi:hypothetical protein
MSESFARSIEELRTNLGVSYMDAILEWCKLNACEVETAAKMVKSDSGLKAKLKAEAEDSKMLKTHVVARNKLPL